MQKCVQRRSKKNSGAPGLVDRMCVIHARCRGLNNHWRDMSERFSQFNRLGYLHPVFCSLSWKNGIKVVVGNCSVSERRLWRPPYQCSIRCQAKYTPEK